MADIARSRFLVPLLLASVLLAGCATKTGVLDLSWTPPTANTDGTTPVDIAAYRVYYGTTPNPCPGGTYITVPPSEGAGQQMTARLTKLTAGELYYVSVMAVSTGGAQSGCSAAASNRARDAE